MEDNEIKMLLDEEIKRTLDDVSKLTTGSQEAQRAMLKLEKLYGQRIREKELELKDKQIVDASISKIDEQKLRQDELEFKVRQAAEDLKLKERELEQKDAELKEARRKRWWQTVLEAAGIAIPAALTGHWLYKGMKFEEEGKIYSSRTQQWFSGFSKLFKR